MTAQLQSLDADGVAIKTFELVVQSHVESITPVQ